MIRRNFLQLNNTSYNIHFTFQPRSYVVNLVVILEITRHKMCEETANHFFDTHLVDFF